MTRVRLVMPACEGNDPNAGVARYLSCESALSICPGAGEVSYWIFEGPPGVVRPGPGQWTLTGTRCLKGSVPGRVIPVLTAADFRRLPLPPARVQVQPVNLRTLVNVETNVMAGVGPVVLSTRLLGQPVRVRARAVRFRWSFGDGEVLDTSDPGAPYPAMRTTHVYLDAGRFSLGLVTDYLGEYSVAGGPWLPVDGVAEVSSAPVRLDVFTAHAVLIPVDGPG